MTKRHSALQPLSRDHHAGLVQAQELTKAASADDAGRLEVLAVFLRAWRDEIAPHFAEEESLLPPLMCEEEIDELYRQHKNLRARIGEAAAHDLGIAPPSEMLRTLGETLQQHIRWEERVLFPAIERNASEEQLDRLAETTLRNEQARRPE